MIWYYGIGKVVMESQYDFLNLLGFFLIVDLWCHIDSMMIPFLMLFFKERISICCLDVCKYNFLMF